MSQRTTCDVCGKEFTKCDYSVSGSVIIHCQQYLGDNGTGDEKQSADLCKACVWKLHRFFHRFKKAKGVIQKIDMKGV